MLDFGIRSWFQSGEFTHNFNLNFVHIFQVFTSANIETFLSQNLFTQSSESKWNVKLFPTLMECNEGRGMFYIFSEKTLRGGNSSSRWINYMYFFTRYNTYLQDLRVANAVTITAEHELPPSYDITYQSEEITDYKSVKYFKNHNLAWEHNETLTTSRKLAQSLDITAGAAISGWGQDGRVDSKYLNRSEVGNRWT